MTTAAIEDNKRRGFDAPVATRNGDHLSRWPFAREIYIAATNGPAEWSVRVGVYGEWGTGKSSVLEFVSSMALADDHVVVWFDPWEHSSKANLWREFVLKVFSELEKKVGGIAEAGDARRKAFTSKLPGIAKSLARLNERVGDATEIGLELLKKHLQFGPDDLNSLATFLGNRRVIILIDDLDRTAAELVPEILFALKELMDLPRFSYIAAFDPVVVGQVLGKDHPGFGDGFNFLEKIIDYPRWLPQPSQDGLTKLALNERQKYCPFVPESALIDAVHLLPQNPRAVRQIIRLLSLLRPQIERHDTHELRWPIIIAANIIKVRHPLLADSLLRDRDFWGKATSVAYGLQREENYEGERDKLIQEHLKIAQSRESISLEPKEADTIAEIMRKLWAAGGAGFLLNSHQDFGYQVEIAEAPAAVTAKEFDEFVRMWTKAPMSKTLRIWVSNHAQVLQRSEQEVYEELFRAGFTRYTNVLHTANTSVNNARKENLLNSATTLFDFIICLVLEQSQIKADLFKVRASELDIFFEKFAGLTNSLPANHPFHAKHEQLLLSVLQEWPGPYQVMVDILQPFHSHPDHFELGRARDLHEKLCAIVLPKFACEVLTLFREVDSIERIWHKEKGTAAARRVLLNPDGPLWKGLRREIFALLEEASNNVTVQENAYTLLHWFDELLREHHGGGVPSEALLLFDNEIGLALWKAAIASPLSESGVVRVYYVAQHLRNEASLSLPPWWEGTLKSSGFKPKRQGNKNAKKVQRDTDIAAPELNVPQGEDPV